MKKVVTLLAAVSMLTASAALAAGAAKTGGAAKPAKEKSLYERLGGLPAIAKVTDEFLNALGADNTVMANAKVKEQASKPGALPYLKYRITEQLCSATGGPCKYGGKTMKEAHKDLGITEAEWNAAVGDLTTVLNANGVPEKEKNDLFAILTKTKKDIVTGGSGAPTAPAPATH